MDELIEIYEKYHDPDKIQSVAVLEHEIARCKKIKDGSQSEELVEELQNRIEILEMAKQ